MSVNRIQKLLFSEYSEFEDMVLVESPFAETTRDGKGIRQVQLGLTPTKFIIATDVIQSADLVNVLYYSGADPYIENFELISVFPVECVNLSVFHHRKRHTIKAHFCNNRILYFELGGFEKKQMFWNLWCERVKFLSPENPGSSRSETSAASSTSNSTIYLSSSTVAVPHFGAPQLWCYYGAGGDGQRTCKTRSTEELCNNPYQHPNLNNSLTEVQLLYQKPQRPRKKYSRHNSSSYSSSEAPISNEENHITQVNRFGSGVPENCITNLYLPNVSYEEQKRWSQHLIESRSDEFMPIKRSQQQIFSMIDVAESGVTVWEKTNIKHRSRHLRRYGFSSHCLFLHGLGLWHISPGDRHSVQAKQAVSAVTIRMQPTDPEMDLPISHHQLTASVSYNALQDINCYTKSHFKKLRSPRRPIVYFWTPEYWYRPRTSRTAYQEMHQHLQQLHIFHELSSSKQTIKGNRSSMRQNRRRNKTTPRKVAGQKNDTVSLLKEILKMDVALSVWDFDSSTLAYQITLIHKDLFLKIPNSELDIVLWQQSSKNAPNICALIAFSHRMSYLVTTEVLQQNSERMRARLIARFINIADKCNNLQNFQSCHSVLTGLQSPPIYRLHHTWSYIRKHHATKYQIFENLCRSYRDPRLPTFQQAFHKASQNPPYLPYIGDLLGRLLGRVQKKGNSTADTSLENNFKDMKDANSQTQQMFESCKKKDIESVSSNCSLPKMVRRFLSAFRIWSSIDSSHSHLSHDSLPITTSTENSYSQGQDSQHNSGYCCITCKNKISSSSLVRYISSFFEPVHPSEDLRIQRLRQVSILLNRSQNAAANYVFCQNELALEYLLKAHYQEEKDNFFYSFMLEPKY